MANFNAKSGLKAALASVAAVGVMSGSALADDRGATYTTASTITQQERQDLSTANSQARAHAKSGFNVAIVFHGGQDVPNAKFESHEQVGEFFRNHYQGILDQNYPQENGQVSVFYAPNPDAQSSGLTVQIGDQLFEVDNAKYGRSAQFDPAILDLNTGWKAAPEIVEHLPLAKALQKQNEADGFTTSASLTYSLPN